MVENHFLLVWKWSSILVKDVHTSIQYLDVQADHVHPAILHFYSAGDVYFPKYNATIHHVKIVRD